MQHNAMGIRVFLNTCTMETRARGTDNRTWLVRFTSTKKEEPPSPSYFNIFSLTCIYDETGLSERFSAKVVPHYIDDSTIIDVLLSFTSPPHNLSFTIEACVSVPFFGAICDKRVFTLDPNVGIIDEDQRIPTKQ